MFAMLASKFSCGYKIHLMCPYKILEIESIYALSIVHR
jgi:hypothetical protein